MGPHSTSAALGQGQATTVASIQVPVSRLSGNWGDLSGQLLLSQACSADLIGRSAVRSRIPTKERVEGSAESGFSNSAVLSIRSAAEFLRRETLRYLA